MKTHTRAALYAIALMLGLSTLAATAAAQPTKKDDNYGYKFDDDLLTAPGVDSMSAQIRVLKKPIREKLHRPRVHFVPEMLKSVENM